MREYFVPKNIDRTRSKIPKKVGKMREYFVPKIFYEVINGKKCVSILYQKILCRNRCMKCVRIFCQYKSRPKAVVKNACAFWTRIYRPKNAVQNAWVFFTNNKTNYVNVSYRQLKVLTLLYQNYYRPKTGVQNAGVRSTGKWRTEIRLKKREYFLPLWSDDIFWY